LYIYKQNEARQMKLINEIVEARNFWEAWMSVRHDHGAAGMDNMPVEELDVCLPAHMDEIKSSMQEKKYKPSPVRRVYIPKPNGKQRPPGIPTVIYRAVQQSAAQVLSRVYEPIFSDSSYGFRPNRSCHMAIGKALDYLNEGYEWIIDFDIEKYFGTTIYQAAKTRLGWYRQCGQSVFNYLPSPQVLAMPKVNRTDKKEPT
jgi:retron-type reverse transcriptase